MKRKSCSCAGMGCAPHSHGLCRRRSYLLCWQLLACDCCVHAGVSRSWASQCLQQPAVGLAVVTVQQNFGGNAAPFHAPLHPPPQRLCLFRHASACVCVSRQVLALFNKAIRKLHSHLKAAKEAAVERQLPRPTPRAAPAAAAAAAAGAYRNVAPPGSLYGVSESGMKWWSRGGWVRLEAVLNGGV